LGKTGFYHTRPNESPLPDPIAYLLTWTTYGTWLSGDDRGWVMRGKGLQLPDPIIRQRTEQLLTETPCVLTPEQRTLVEQTIADHCRIRHWHLHAVNCRTNHIHAVVTSDRHPDDVRDQFKAWCTRRLNKLAQSHGDNARENWWTERGSKRYINDDHSLECAIRYVNEAQ
jgi:REP element-mobilizing transposase RayT